jgi:hypothetical protein
VLIFTALLYENEASNTSQFHTVSEVEKWSFLFWVHRESGVNFFSSLRTQWVAEGLPFCAKKAFPEIELLAKGDFVLILWPKERENFLVKVQVKTVKNMKAFSVLFGFYVQSGK